MLSAAMTMAGCGPAQDTGNVLANAADARIAITVTGNGLRSDTVSSDETAAACARFRLTPAQVSEYFARAETVDGRAYNHDLDMSRCYATGTVRFADGKAETWAIDQARRGYLARADGSHRYMVCNACSAPPYFEEENTGDGDAMDNS